jgi:hypothetical protein
MDFPAKSVAHRNIAFEFNSHKKTLFAQLKPFPYHLPNAPTYAARTPAQLHRRNVLSRKTHE